uniref:Homeobox protein cut-like n=1 Tax=Eptatretus burgeri TaxID=7764 RepID=A0A8C4Q2S5_EPTBU
MDTELARKDGRLAWLAEEVRRLQSNLAELQEASAAQILQLEAQLADRNRRIQKLEEKLKSRMNCEIKMEINAGDASDRQSTGVTASQGPAKELLPCQARRVRLREPDGSQPPDTQIHGPPPTWQENGGPGSRCPSELSACASPRPCPPSTPASEPTALYPPALGFGGAESLPAGIFSGTPLPMSAGRFSLSPFFPKQLLQSVYTVKAAHEASLYQPGLYVGAIASPPAGARPGSTHSASPRLGASPALRNGQPEGGGVRTGIGALRTEGEIDEVNTSELARHVKEQLLKHNIGQRVFGHYVLGLSQGSVSEILARPKPWTKLTVKGKEPFLKMKQFLSDEQNVLALRAIQVKQRAEQISMPSPVPEHSSSDDTIRSLLEQARREMDAQRTAMLQAEAVADGTPVPATTATSCSSSSSASSSSSSSLCSSSSSLSEPTQHSPAAGAAAVGRGPEPQGDGGTVADGSSGSSGSTQAHAEFVQNIIRRVKTELEDGRPQPCTKHRPSSVAQAFYCPPPTSPIPSTAYYRAEPFRPFSTGPPDSQTRRVHTKAVMPTEGQYEGVSNEPTRGCSEMGPSVGEAGTPATTVGGSLLGKPPRPCIPPLTPEQYEVYMYREVDTAELTRLVKEKLTKNGICQRVFGEKVLGLSQGSVSDMLSRPKPWSKLTQKGREPFIRMQLWLNDDLPVSSTAEASPSSQAGDPDPCSPSSEPAPSPGESVRSLTETVAIATESFAMSAAPAASVPSPQLSLSSPGLEARQEEDHVSPAATPALSLSAISIQELVAMSPELDTYCITKRVKEVLTDNNLGQRLFGETVLGLTQGSVSDLLARPKPWQKLSLKGREPFVRMQLWLNDPHSVDRLRNMKRMEKKASLKRRSTVIPDGESPVPPPTSPAPAAVSPAPTGLAKKARVVLAPEEKEALKRAYEEEPYPSQQTIEMLAAQLGLRTSTVINWFHNYRSRIRREHFIEEMQQKSPGLEGSCTPRMANDGAVDDAGLSPDRPRSTEEQRLNVEADQCQVLQFESYSLPPASIKQEMVEEEASGICFRNEGQEGLPLQTLHTQVIEVGSGSGSGSEGAYLDEGVKGQLPLRSNTFFSDLLMARATSAALRLSSPEPRTVGKVLSPAVPLLPFLPLSASSSPSPGSSPKPEAEGGKGPLVSPFPSASPSCLPISGETPPLPPPLVPGASTHSPLPPGAGPGTRGSSPLAQGSDGALAMGWKEGSVRKALRDEVKAANLNSIINRLEKAASRDDSPDWEF